jgi:cytidylate kinase
MTQPLVIAIDGPAGAGKSTVAQALAGRLGLAYVDSGATYRAAALRVLESGVAPDDERAVVQVIGRTDVQVTTDGFQPRVLVDGRDVTGRLRSAEVALGAAQVSRFPEVRAKLIEVQRSFAKEKGVVMEGRDIGTVVFPQAALKIFLTADPQERACRRLEDQRQSGHRTTLERTADEITRRDQLDTGRAVSPLMPAHDAIIIDSTYLTAEQVVDQIMSLLRERGLTGL